MAGTAGRFGRGTVRLAGSAALLLSLALSAATLNEDYLRGQTAYQRGDVVGAMAALRPAARAGHAPAQSLLAFILDRADFVDEAAQLYRDAAAQGDPEGLAGLANLQLTGRGLAKDEKAAFVHFSKAADAGHAPSVEVVASAWLKGQMGCNAAAEPAAAVAAWRRAAAGGHLPSVEALQLAYQQGRHGLAADPAETARWQQRVAELRKQRAAKPVVKAAR